jgi:HEAT repeat protein
MTESTAANEKAVDMAAARALEDEQALEDLLYAISLENKNRNVRYQSFLALMKLAEQHPSLLYPCWDRLVELLGSDNDSAKFNALHLLAALTPVDVEGRFESIFDQFFKLLGSPSVTLAAHTASVAGQIARAKPGLQAAITAKLLDIDKVSPLDAERRGLVKAYAIESFGEYFEDAANKDAIVKFVWEQQENKSPKTRKIAKEFLKKWAGQP